MHFMGHSYHALSDIMCDFTTPPETRRLRAAASVLVEQSSVIRATIPMAVPASMLSANPNTIPTPNSSSSGPTPPPGQPESNLGGLGGHPPSNFVGAGQPQMNFGMGGQPQVNFGSPGQHQINFGGLGQPQMSFTGTTQGGLGIPDLSALLGPALAGGMMNFIQVNVPQSGRPASTNTANANNIPSSPSATPGAASASVPGRPQPATNNNSLPGNPIETNNLPQQLRNELSRPPFDILLSCNSHHGCRNQSNNRPANLHQFVNVGESSSSRVNHGSSEDFILNCADLIRQSNLLNVLQPMFHDVIVNYLMRGRDAKNSDHIRSCGRSLAKKVSPFFESFTVI